MNRHCPVFIIESCAAIASDKFITSATLPLNVFTNKLSEHLNKYYLPISADMLGDIAESYLRVLVESNIDDSNDLLKSYIYNRIHFRRTGKNRSWGSAISNPTPTVNSGAVTIKIIKRTNITSTNGVTLISLMGSFDERFNLKAILNY